MPLSRRTLLVAGITLPSLLSCALRPPVPGFARLRGEVRVNGAPASPDRPITPDSTVVTGSDSLAILSIGGDAFLIRENSEVRFQPAPPQLAAQEPTEKKSDAGPLITLKVKRVQGFFLKTGRILSVFGPGPERTLHTPTAVAGIRGTGIYMEEEEGRAYICACYGTTTLHPAYLHTSKQTITTRHHESPFYVYPQGAAIPIEVAPMINHTDEELILLEALHDRRPPFYDPFNPHGKKY